MERKTLYLHKLIKNNFIFVTLDAAINRQKMEAFIVANDIRRLKKMQGRFPYDFDEVDYPSLYAYLIKTRLHAYVVMFANDVTYRNLHIIKIMQNDFYDKDGFDTRRLIYPV